MPLPAILAATLAASALPAAIEADIQCLAVFSLYPGKDSEEQAGITGAIMFYLGRIEGRAPRTQIEPRLRELIADAEFRENRLPTHAQRCGNEMVIKGGEVQKIGNAIDAGQTPRGDRR